MGRQFMARTPDGRALEVYADGAEGGVPLLFHNGTPSTGQPFAPFVEAAAERGLRTVSFSRAGYGRSTRKPGRRVADVVPDVVAVLDALGAERFYTLGWSGGGPHALACAALLPERVLAAATVGSLAPYGARGLDWMAGMGDQNVVAFRAALATPDELRALAEAVASTFATATGDQLAATLDDLVSDVDRQALTGQAAAWLADIFRESVRNGFWGWYDDEIALVSRWGFDLAEMALPIAVWQGRQDRMTPHAHGAWLVEHIPHARAHLLHDHGHLSLGLDSFGVILDDLLAVPTNLPG
jgi:pimeloyl-ACP methyl ester carboxylesterase